MLEGNSYGIAVFVAVFLGLGLIVGLNQRHQKKSAAPKPAEQIEKDYQLFKLCMVGLCEGKELCAESRYAIMQVTRVQKKEIMLDYYNLEAEQPDYDLGRHAIIMARAVLFSLTTNTKGSRLTPDEIARLRQDYLTLTALPEKIYGSSILGIARQMSSIL